MPTPDAPAETAAMRSRLESATFDTLCASGSLRVVATAIAKMKARSIVMTQSIRIVQYNLTIVGPALGQKQTGRAGYTLTRAKLTSAANLSFGILPSAKSC